MRSLSFLHSPCCRYKILFVIAQAYDSAGVNVAPFKVLIEMLVAHVERRSIVAEYSIDYASLALHLLGDGLRLGSRCGLTRRWHPRAGAIADDIALEQGEINGWGSGVIVDIDGGDEVDAHIHWLTNSERL